MFEVEGRQVTLEDLQNQAKLQGLDFDVYYDKLKSQKNVVELGSGEGVFKLDSNVLNKEKQPRVKTWGGLVELEEIEPKEPDFIQDKFARVGQSVFGLVNDVLKMYESGEGGQLMEFSAEGPLQVIAGDIATKLREKGYDIPETFAGYDLTTPETRRAMYEDHLIESAKKGIPLADAQKLDPTNRYKLEKTLEWFDKHTYDVDTDEEGNPLDYTELLAKGEVAKGLDAFSQDLAAGLPSIIISRIPYGIGPALLGSSAYMSNFEQEFYERLGETKPDGSKITRDDIVKNSIISGAADFVTEYAGGRLLNGLIGKGVPKNQIEKLLTQAPKTFMNKIGLGFVSEFGSEGTAGVIREAADALTYGDDKGFKDYFRTFIKDGFVGGFLGAGTVGVVSTPNKKDIYEYVSPAKYKQDQLKIESEIIKAKTNLAKATGSDKKYLESKIKSLEAQKQKHKDNLFNFFENLTKEEKQKYARNIDKQHEALNIIGNRKYDEAAQKEAKEDLKKFTKANEFIFQGTDVKYNADLEASMGRVLKAAERIEEQKGIFGYSAGNVKLKYLNSQSQVDKLIESRPDLKGIAESDGMFLDQSQTDDGKATIYINTQIAANAEATNVLGHEFLHAIISNSFKKSGIGREALKSSVGSFVKYLKDTGNQNVVETIENRLASKYDALTENGQVLRDENGIVKFSKEKEGRYEEYFTIFSDIIKDGQIKSIPGKDKGLVNSMNSLLKGFGFNSVDFQDGKQVFDFLSTYNENINRKGLLGKITARTVAKTKLKGLEAKSKKDAVGFVEKRSMTAAEKATAQTEIKKFGREGLLGESFVEQAKQFGEGTGKQMFDAEFDDIYNKIQNEGYLDNLIAAKYKGGTAPIDFVKKVYSELTPHAKRFNPENKSADLFIWLNSQIGNKATQLYNREYKADQTTAGRARDIGETTQEGEVKIQVAAETDAALEALETEDLSIPGQARLKQEKTEKKSKFRRALGFETDGENYNKVLVATKKSLLLAYNKTQSITDKAKRAIAIREIIRKEYFTKGLTSDLFKPIKNFLGAKPYIKNLKQHREAIVNSISTADFVQMERKVLDNEKIFTVFDRKLTSKKDVQDAVNKDLLPPDALDKIDKGQAVNLYRKRMPTEAEFITYADQPAVNPITGARSGLKGTRKDGFAKAMSNTLVLDAIMEVRQSQDVVERLGDDVAAQLDVEVLAAAIGRDVDVKFSRTIAESKYNSAVELTKLQRDNKTLPAILKQQIAIEKRIEEDNILEEDLIALNFLQELEALVEQGNDVVSTYELLAAKLPVGLESLNIETKNVIEFVEYIKNTTLPQIREQGFRASVVYLENSLKGKTLKQQKQIIDGFLKNIGRSARTEGVEGITRNRQLKEEIIDNLLDGKFKNVYNLKKVESGEAFENVELYENIQNIKNNARSDKELKQKINRQAVEAQEFIFEILDSNLSLSQKLAMIDLMAVDQRGPIRKLYKIGSVAIDNKLTSKNLVLEHEVTAADMVGYLKKYAKNQVNKKTLQEIIEKARVHVLPRKIDDIFKKEGLKSKGNIQRYQNPKVKKYLKNLKDKKVIDFIPADIDLSENANVIANAVLFSRSTNEPKGITVLDFDDTLATSKSLIRFTRPDGSKGTLTPEQYAATYEDLADLGYVFDFSEFSKVVDGKPAPLLNKAKKLADKFGTKNVFILTARPADSAPAIKQFLKENGLDIPLENITGLGNSTAEAKALWIADKVANGYNDFYFADDALKNVQAVQNMLDQFDVKSKVQQAKVKFSRTLSPEFNKMIQRTKGVGAEKIFSRVAGKKRGKNVGKFRFFVPPSADDFAGLLRYFVGKGEQGNKDLKFFNEALIKPFARADEGMKRMRQTILEDYKTLRKTFPDVTKKLRTMVDETGFTFDNAVRVYLWDRAGFEIPGLSKEDIRLLTNRIKTDQDLKNFAEVVANIANQPEGYLEPGQQWEVESIGSDLQNVVNKVGRKKFLGEWIENKNEIFSDENLNKIEAIYGSNFREALENILWRMENGTNRAAGMGRIESAWNNWINGSVGAIMFFNARSAVLQTLSTVNFINFEDNNIFAAAKAFANQKQYWKDFSFLFNSSFLKQRRAGLQTNINEAELASAVAGATNKAKAALQYILKIGFTPTQVADSFAIASGGATYYRNRIKKYIKEGMDQKAAEKQAMLDFQEIAEETQQSARPDRISQQQASSLGRIILAFANTPMQYNRLIKKAAGDLRNKRGDWRSNVSRIIYYGALQNIIFSSLQSAIFALAFDDEEPEEDEINQKTQRIINGTIDTLLRGSGIAGAVVATIKNTVLKFAEEDKDKRPEFERVLIEMLQVSPPIGSKARKIYSALKTYEYNRDVIPEMGKFDLENPIYNIVGNVTEATVNLPLGRLFRKIDNMKEVFNQDNQTWQRVALALGWDQWSLGIDPYKEVKQAERDLRAKKNKNKPKKFKGRR